MTTKLHLSPTRIADYFQHQCERKLLLGSLAKTQNTAKSSESSAIHSDSIDSLFNDYLTAKGGAWENDVIKEFESYGTTVYRPTILTDKLSVQETHSWIQGIQTQEYIFQARFEVPSIFYDRFDIDHSKFHFSDCYPDLLQRIPKGNDGDKDLIRIIDLKTSRSAQAKHKIQILVYACILDAIIDSLGLKDRVAVDWDHAEVRLPSQPEPIEFSLQPIRKHLEYFLEQTLPRFATNIDQPEKADWHLTQTCEHCSNLMQCQKDANDTTQHGGSKSVMLIPYISKQAVRFLREKQISTLAELEQNMTNIKLMFDDNFSLQREKSTLEQKVKALVQGEKYKSDMRGATIPEVQDYAVFVSAQFDPISTRMFAATVTVYEGESSVPDSRLSWTHVAQSVDDCENVERGLLETLHYALSEAQRLSRTAQTYVMDNYEWKNVEQIFQTFATDNKASDLLMHYHTLRTFGNDQQPEDFSVSPVVVLTSLVSSLYALPGQVVYRIGDIADAFLGKGSYQAQLETDYPLSNAIHPRLIYRLWYGDLNITEKDEILKKLVNELRARMQVAHDVVSHIQTEIKSENLFSLIRLRPFHFPVQKDFKDKSRMAKLDFMTQYEFLLAYHDVRRKRALPIAERLEKMYSVIVNYVGEQQHQSPFTADDQKEEASQVNEKIVYRFEVHDLNVFQQRQYFMCISQRSRSSTAV